ncbi:GspH/FimT family pseudopilin [Marinobacter orientalis]|uniref:Type II secretion system protein H n=1 Tax=Marinobacter orientalis TaxID=1928859 RepID=A0A7Y0WU18_9GAMM|nr:GspH/FimT family pseudopilin [Marinobacter orientalis]NMT65514.1 prepilin-type N-terminal cleavage/methylation domain-containing protein [Marinobacter orientalis]TGX47137.1 prepilin-type N-terminal cleavage/methylation domain-containing protein [Marinobacter orientalis]
MSGIQRSSGFTLLELLITITILGIVATVAVPSFREMVLNSRISTQTNEITGLISFARSEASKLREGAVTICASTDSTSCSGSSSWETGLIVFRDDDMNAAFGGTDQLLKVSGPLAGGNTLRIRDMTSDGGGYVQFDSKGFPRASATDETAGSFIICDDRGAAEARAVSVNFSGQANLARDTDADGVLNDHKSNNISCP